ncbi:TIGR04141 family sporadically distributed protein [Actinoplanes sp. NEAU-A12]|uniref:TIGR04141 family sporadically distributed protein n=1 Tax=Actinoplanes sandaracinus TaxID=3045177 RepID=A0ABT6WBY6_9ACTN|nr:DUF6119 family protein [Actinoplanes sandaracinus]MDI6097257.1 TIGR04141 family sporadically distributed protein [Actinoplanes sandaracinus]
MDNTPGVQQLTLPFVPLQVTPAKAGRAVEVHRTTVYRLTTPANRDGLRAALNWDYLDEKDFTVEDDVMIAGLPALLVHGTVPCESADWCHVVTSLTSVEVAIGYSSAGSAILLALDDNVYGLAFGHVGRHLFRSDLVEPGFGIHFAIRSIDPRTIKALQRRVFDARGRVDHSTVLGGQPIRAFAVETFGEMIGQIKGGLTEASTLAAVRSGRRLPTVTGSDSLQVPLSTDPDGLVADLRSIGCVCATASPDPELEFIAQVQPVKAGLRTERLNKALDELLGQDDPVRAGLSLPSGLAEYVASADAFRIAIPGFRPAIVDDIDLDDVLRTVRTRGDGRRLNTLKTGTIGIAIDGQPEPVEVSAHRWLTAEIPSGASRMIYLDGQWYEIGERYLDFLRAEINTLLTTPSSITLPPWDSTVSEEVYNKIAAAQPGYLCLDQKFVRSGLHSWGQGIEVCDLLGPADELIHVKRADRSSLLSHLFAQGVVSADTLQTEPQARERFAARVEEVSDGKRTVPLNFMPTKVVYAIALKSGDPLTPQTLFTFAQVAMRRAVRHLRASMIDVEVVAIPSA